LFEAGNSNQQSTYHGGGLGAKHTLSSPTSLAFGLFGEMATIHDSHVLGHGPEETEETPVDGVGPTLHVANLSFYDGGTASHLDMLHDTPVGMGIAWDHDRVYWVFDGGHSSITRYDFKEVHELGGDDHSDGEIRRYVEGSVSHDPVAPSHLELDEATGLLYIADTGNNRIAVLDTSAGTDGEPITPNYDDCYLVSMEGGVIETLVDGEEIGLEKPSGLALIGDHVLVTDNGTSKILAFDKVTGELIDWLETGLPAGSLMGLTTDQEGGLFLVDAVANHVIHLRVADE